MNKIEVTLGAAIALSAFFFILFLNQGVVRSSSGSYTYQFPKELSGWCLVLLLLIGPITIVHGAFASRLVELGLGISVTIWTYSVWFWVISLYSINYAEVGFIRQFPSSHTLVWLFIAPNTLWGAFLVADGILTKKKAKRESQSHAAGLRKSHSFY